ncbi:DUF4358 domain-containing protein [Psychrobacillus sp. INOP01]|uniref:DUF4358 domain-containing protein n=1 Tax=Psychrobacillus sp. INOP01 TaxID=2829187 RepID=UPI001BA89966|nr:DUF4358 domain-containing protein [Psychrobacillus sp. INOP01]QUG41766.1 DUF4358 domain-containing protein [Psychrobacillus sp. INOP01]
MKKMLGILIGALVVFAMVGCSSTGKNEGGTSTPDVKVKDIMVSIKAQIVQDIKDAGFDDGQSDEQILQGYVETNLVDTATDDLFGQMFFERTGLDKELLAEGSMYISMFNINADEIIVLKAKDDKSVDTLKASLQKELDAQIQTWERYLPEQYEKVKNNVLKTKGNYILYVTYDNVDAVEKIFDEKVK